MTYLDYLLLAIVGASVLLAFMRGMVSELLSLAAWVVALYAARAFSADVEHWVPAWVSAPNLRWLGSFVAIMIVVWIGMSLFRRVVSLLIRSVGLGAIDRTLGAVFGLVRGVLLATVLVLLGGLTHLPREPVWQQSQLLPLLQPLAVQVQSYLPADMAQRIQLPPGALLEVQQAVHALAAP